MVERRVFLVATVASIFTPNSETQTSILATDFTKDLQTLILASNVTPDLQKHMCGLASLDHY